MTEYASYEVEWVEALQARADRWEAEARILGRDTAGAAELLAAALGYSDRFHTDAPLGTSILLFLARQAADRALGVGPAGPATEPGVETLPCRRCGSPRRIDSYCNATAECVAAMVADLREQCEVMGFKLSQPGAGDTEPATGNTHIAIVECSVPPSIELIANGPHNWCVERLTAWTETHPTPQYCRAYVVEITDEVICEPGVGVYTVPVSGVRDDQPGGER